MSTKKHRTAKPPISMYALGELLDIQAKCPGFATVLASHDFLHAAVFSKIMEHTGGDSYQAKRQEILNTLLEFYRLASLD